MVKGRQAPIKVFRVLSIVETDSTEATNKATQLIGREGVIDFLWFSVAGTDYFLRPGWHWQ